LQYDVATIRLHWLTASLVGLLWLIGQIAELAPKGVFQNVFWSIHVALGFFLAFVLIGRFLWRASEGYILPPADNGVLHTIAEMNHYLLYSLLLLVISLGAVNAFFWAHELFGVGRPPQLDNLDWKKTFSDLHELAANILIFVASLHTLAALGHHFILRDDVLRRMLLPSSEPLINRKETNRKKH